MAVALGAAVLGAQAPRAVSELSQLALEALELGDLVVASTPSLLIGELASRLGLNPKTIRYYEEVGLLPEPERSDGGYRRYGRSDEERLRFVRGVRRLGFALGEIREVLALARRRRAG